MTEPLPSDFMPFGHVVGRVIRAVGDTDADPDSDPEAIPVTGKGLVRFTPLELTRVVTGTVPSTWVQQEPIAADLDSEGFIALSGARGLLLWPGAWKVSAGSASTFSFPAFTIEVTSAHTADAPLDLWTAAPYSPPAGATVTTLVVPAGAAAGQILAWDGQKLAWQEPPADGAPGEPGHSPVLTWQGDQLAVDGVVSGPHLTGPRGPVGAASTWEDWGPGRPDILSTIPEDHRPWVQAAQPGAVWHSTDGAGTGLESCTLLPTGRWGRWRGDTGQWTVLRPTLPTDTPDADQNWVRIRRVDSTLWVEVQATTKWTLDLPNDWIPTWEWGFRFGYEGPSGIQLYKRDRGYGGFVILRQLHKQVAVTDEGHGLGSWITDKPWPLTLT